MGNPKIIVQSLNDLIPLKLRPILRRWHLGRDVITGFVGDRGEGKSLGGGKLAFRDHMMWGEPCWSNMHIKVAVEVSNAEAERYGLQGGTIIYESQQLDSAALLRLDDMFQGGIIYIDEPNMEFAEARRSQTNTNLFYDRAGQQLRKMQSAHIYSVINEMWVDNRMRDLTDNFIRTRDVALDPENLLNKMSPGQRFEWVIYPMSRKLCGVTYSQLGHPLPGIQIDGKIIWGIIDTYQKQAEGKTKYGIKFDKAAVDMELSESKVVMQEKQKWGWLYDKIQQLHDQGIPAIRDEVLWEFLNLKERGILASEVGKQLSKMGIKKRELHGGKAMYGIDLYSLDKLPIAQKEAILVVGGG